MVKTIKDTMKIFQEIPQEPKQNVEYDAREDVWNHKRLGNNILRIIPYKKVPLRQISINLDNILDDLTDNPNNIDRNMDATIEGNVDNAINTVGLKHDSDSKIRNAIRKTSNDFIKEYHIDFGYGNDNTREWIQEINKSLIDLSKNVVVKYIKALQRTVSKLIKEYD